ncbi:GIY-YIG nuclease family protein [Candidatus Parcubacteria bacterium]|nr:GIY-YIG nuclease family protein [Candidatus Parcubacteria bacterium]
MFYVYILRSEAFDQIYTGFTKDLKNRVLDHNSGKSIHTKKFKPWKLVTYVAFDEEGSARDFEKYLKTGSGIAFARRHLLD